MKQLLILGFLALSACTPTPEVLPEDFNAEFEF